MRDTDDEGLPRLSGQCSTTFVHNRAGHPERNLVILVLEQKLDSVESCLGVGRVEDGLHGEDVHPSVKQGTTLGSVGIDQLVKRDVPEVWLLH